MMPILFNLVLIAGGASINVMPSAYYKEECQKYASTVESQVKSTRALCIPLGTPNQLPAELGKK